MTAPLTFQELLFRLQAFWAQRGCILPAALRRGSWRGYHGAGDLPARAGAQALQGGLCPALAAAGRRPLRREPHRLFKHTQFQLILKPPPVNVQELYLESLEAMGIDLASTT